MSREMRFTDPGEGIHEAEVVELMVETGDTVQEGDSALAVETDKATTELLAPYGGRVADVAVAVGDRIRVDDLLLTFAGDGDSDGDGDGAVDPGDDDHDRASDAAPDDKDAAAADSGDAPTAQEMGVGPKRGGKGPVPAAPSTRRFARELGVALETRDGSGPGGRVLDSDVRAAAEGGDSDAEAAATARDAAPQAEAPPSTEAEATPEHRPAPAYEPPNFSRWGEVERVPLRSVRRATARKMARAWAENPHVMHHDHADVTSLEQFRRDHADELTPVAGGDPDAPELAARLLLPLCLAFDHRLNDGAGAAHFVNRLRDSLQDPESLLLGV